MIEEKWAYEDLEEGRGFKFGPRQVTAEDILDFSRQFDIRPMDLDGKATNSGKLRSSGWHSCAIFMRMMCDEFLLDSTSQGSPGIPYLRWITPLFAGDTISARAVVVSRRRSKTRRDLGFVTFRNEVTNQKDELVLEFENMGMFLLRHPEIAA